MKIAVIGTGISGMAMAYTLCREHDITVYEKESYIGGHSRTSRVKTPEGDIPVDTGFIVFNKRNYPHLTLLLQHLDVPIAPTNMSFGVSIDNGWLEYGTYHKLSGLFAQKRNLARGPYLKMLRDILYFNKHARQYLNADSDMTLGDVLDALQMGPWFRQYYLLAMGAAIWSTPTQKMMDFPAQTFLRFFDNHGLLTVSDHPQWYTVIGGSKEYVKRLTASYQDKIRLNCGVHEVRRDSDTVIVTDSHGESETYDQVVFACHSDQALSLLSTPTDAEKAVLGAIKYQPNTMVLHTDQSFMPRHKKAWSSWVYQSEAQNDQARSVSLSYWMNNLQPLKTNTPIIVTLNPGRSVQEDLIHDQCTLHHPVFDGAAAQAQKRLDEIQGTDRIWYCGAWQRYGFHEDGLQSAVKAAKKMGLSPPWM